MLADVIEQTRTQNAAGQITREWDYDNPSEVISNYTRSILGGGIRVVGSTEDWDDEYMDINWAKLRTSTLVSKRHRITNIRDAITGETLWKQIDNDGNESAIIFDVQGIQPVIDGFGSVVEYDVLLRGVQDD
jgi:hypothetical protein